MMSVRVTSRRRESLASLKCFCSAVIALQKLPHNSINGERGNVGGEPGMCLGKVWLLLFGRVCFVGCESFNQFGFERIFRALDHRQTVAALVVLNLVHDVVDEEHAPA